MATRLPRLRIPPTWRAGLRLGKERNEATLAILSSPVMMERLRRADEQLRAWGVEAMPMDRVKQPFDYERR
jgi:hypothetical protein